MHIKNATTVLAVNLVGSDCSISRSKGSAKFASRHLPFLPETVQDIWNLLPSFLWRVTERCFLFQGLLDLRMGHASTPKCDAEQEEVVIAMTFWSFPPVLN